MTIFPTEKNMWSVFFFFFFFLFISFMVLKNDEE